MPKTALCISLMSCSARFQIRAVLRRAGPLVKAHDRYRRALRRSTRRRGSECGWLLPGGVEGGRVVLPADLLVRYRQFPRRDAGEREQPVEHGRIAAAALGEAGTDRFEDRSGFGEQSGCLLLGDAREELEERRQVIGQLVGGERE